MTIASQPRYWMSAAILLAGLCLAAPREGDGQIPSYQPSRPTLSPYLNLTRRNFGGLPNYFALVRPIERQQQLNLQQQGVLQTDRREIQQLQNDVQRGLIPPSATGSTSWFFVPGNQQRFQDTTGYYPAPVISRRQQFRY